MTEKTVRDGEAAWGPAVRGRLAAHEGSELLVGQHPPRPQPATCQLSRQPQGSEPESLPSPAASLGGLVIINHSNKHLDDHFCISATRIAKFFALHRASAFTNVFTYVAHMSAGPLSLPL